MNDSQKKSCAEPRCERAPYTRGYCRKCYNRLYQSGMLPGGVSRKRRKCDAPGCTRDGHAKGYCRRHYSQIWRTGRVKTDKTKTVKKVPKVDGWDEERTRSMEASLRAAKEAYRRTSTFAAQCRWSHTIRELERELANVNQDKGVLAVTCPPQRRDAGTSHQSAEEA